MPARLIEELLDLPIDERRRNEIEQLAEEWLPGRFANTFVEDSDEAVPLIRLLVRSRTRRAELRTALEELALEQSSDAAAAASRFISAAPPIYTVLIDSDRQLPQRERLTYLSQSALRRGDHCHEEEGATAGPRRAGRDRRRRAARPMSARWNGWAADLRTDA